MKNILEALERSAMKFPGKIAFAYERSAMTYHQLLTTAQAIGSTLAQQVPEYESPQASSPDACRRLYGRSAPGHAASQNGVPTRAPKDLPMGRPVAVLMARGCECLCACFGVVYSGNFYTIIDDQMPKARIEAIFSQLNPAAVIMDAQARERYGSISRIPVLDYELLAGGRACLPILEHIRSRMIDTDPLYILFTSGSTGVPKGTVVSHRNVIAYTDWLTGAFRFNEDTIFGNQAPFYFSMSVLDVYSTLRHGATMFIIPRQLFSFPVQLLKFLKEHRVNTIYWVPSALMLASAFQALDYVELPHLKMILFAGEVMHVPQLRPWLDHFPKALFANLYGPTEVTDICSYYVIDRPFKDDEPLPIGKACDNCALMILNEQGQPAAPNEYGLLYVRGSFVAAGYYNAPDKTAQAFVQNPLNPYYPEPVYNTGDLVYARENGEIMYVGRRDFQIKHMGYRIELGEIEAAAAALTSIARCVCLYEARRSSLVLICQTREKAAGIREALRQKLPPYMVPDEIICTKKIPCNANGKADRTWLKENYLSQSM